MLFVRLVLVHWLVSHGSPSLQQLHALMPWRPWRPWSLPVLRQPPYITILWSASYDTSSLLVTYRDIQSSSKFHNEILLMRSCELTTSHRHHHRQSQIYHEIPVPCSNRCTSVEFGASSRPNHRKLQIKHNSGNKTQNVRITRGESAESFSARVVKFLILQTWFSHMLIDNVGTASLSDRHHVVSIGLFFGCSNGASGRCYVASSKHIDKL